MEQKLIKYNQKRDFEKTTEPIGKKGKSTKKLRFVVQHHMARKEHYDFRLEWKGTLKSWAVPKGPSYSMKDKRLAVEVEDHPLSYRNFEGVIPKGEYGGGVVLLFDEGFWEPLEDPNVAFSKGKIKFLLKGTRLQGLWSLIRFKDNQWLLRKENDSVFLFSSIKEYRTSIKTGRTMKEILEHCPKKIQNSKKLGIVESIQITNPDKIIAPKVTKMDLVNYYKGVSKRMLPFLKERIISTIRAPQGIEGECFFKKHLENENEGIGVVNITNDSGKREDYYFIREVSGLISEVQMNSYEFHTWASQVGSLNHPNVLVFDLDPDESVSLSKIRQGVKDLKSILDELSLASFLKTSGGKGYHVVVPTYKLKTWKEFRAFAFNVAKLMEMKWPDRYVSNVRKDVRKGKIFIDWIRNTKGATSVAPYSVRIRKKLRVSMPIAWRELDKVKPDGITMEEALRRVKRKDPWVDFFTIDQ